AAKYVWSISVTPVPGTFSSYPYDGRVAPVPITDLSQNEGAPGLSHLGVRGWTWPVTDDKLHAVPRTPEARNGNNLLYPPSQHSSRSWPTIILAVSVHGDGQALQREHTSPPRV